MASLLNRILRPLFQDQFGRGPDGRDPYDPYEVDRMWKNFNNRLSRLFKGKKSSPPEEPEEPQNNNQPPKEEPDIEFDAKKSALRLGILMMLGAGFLFWLGTGFFIVQEGETGVVMTFGRFSKMTSSGVNWRYPTPFQSHEVVNVSQVRTVEVGYRSTLRNKMPKEALMLTNDENIVDIQFAVQYRLKNAADWVFNNRDQEEMVRQVAEASIREVVGKNKMDFVLYEGRDQIAIDAHSLMQQIFDQYQSGVQVTNVTMQGVQPPEQVQAAFDDAVKAGQDLERQKNEGEAYANAVIPRAKGTAARLIQEAEGYRDQVIANAEGNAARFKMIVDEYKKAPGVTRDRMYIQAMQDVFSSTTKVLVDVRGSSNLLYLPFDKLLAESSQPTPQMAPQTPPTMPSETPKAPKVEEVPQPAVPQVAVPSTPESMERIRETRDRGVR